jgi:spermidine synthase
VLADARLSLAATQEKYDVLVLDAYSSDSVPAHLLTREAMALYLQRLTPHGTLVFHISNRYLDLQPVLAGLAQDAGLVCLVQSRDRQSTTEAAKGGRVSTWAVLARRVEDLGPITNDPRWFVPKPQAAVGVWTDDFYSVWRTFTGGR